MIILANSKSDSKPNNATRSQEDSNSTRYLERFFNSKSAVTQAFIYLTSMASSAKRDDERESILGSVLAEKIFGGYGSFQQDLEASQALKTLGSGTCNEEDEREAKLAWQLKVWKAVYYFELAVMMGFAFILLFAAGNKLRVAEDEI